MRRASNRRKDQRKSACSFRCRTKANPPGRSLSMAPKFQLQLLHQRNHNHNGQSLGHKVCENAVDQIKEKMRCEYSNAHPLRVGISLHAAHCGIFVSHCSICTWKYLCTIELHISAEYQQQNNGIDYIQAGLPKHRRHRAHSTVSNSMNFTQI